MIYGNVLVLQKLLLQERQEFVYESIILKNGDSYFCRPMLQKGNIVTEWTGDGSFMTEDGFTQGITCGTNNYWKD